MAKVSAIIPNYNHARFLRRRVESVLAQTWPELEVILMDDCSSDASRDVIAEFASHPRVRVLLNERNSGSTFRQWNKGVRHATGEYVWFAESDDLAEPTLLERVAGALEAHPECGIGCCESWLLHGEGEPGPDNLEPHYRPRPRRDHWTRDFVSDGATICIEDLLLANPMPNASALVLRRSVYERVGGADESMRQAGDRMTWAKMLTVSGLVHVADRLNYYRCHGATVRAKRGGSGRTIAEVYSVLRHIRDHVPIPPAKFERALEHNAAYFAKAAAARGVGLAEMVRACREVADVDPGVWRRLLAPWLLRRTLGGPVRSARRLRQSLFSGAVAGGHSG